VKGDKKNKIIEIIKDSDDDGDEYFEPN